jgi:alpha-galactosidase
MLAEFDQTSGRLTFRDLETGGAQIQSAVAWARYRLANGTIHHQPLISLGATIQEDAISDGHGAGAEWILSCPRNADGIAVTFRIKSYEKRPFLLLRLSLQDQSREPVFLQDLCLFQASPSNGGQLRLKIPSEGYRFLKVGWHGWDDSSLRSMHDRNSRSWLDQLTRLSYSNPATRKPRAQGEFCSEGWGIMAGIEAAIVAGFVSTAHQFGQVYASLWPGHEGIMLLTQADGIRLDPDEMCDSEWGYLQFVPLPDPAPEADYVQAVARQMHARVPAIPPPPMWTHWYQFFHDIREEIFLHSLDALAEKRQDIPFRVAALDDGYQAAWGDWTATNDKFPHGLEWLAKEISSRGFTPGLWLAPFAVQSKSQMVSQHPDWLVKDKKGRPAQAGFLYNMFIQALDLTHPEVLDHLGVMAHTLAQEWGFGMLKIDFLNAAALPGVRYNPKLTRAQALRLGLEAVRQGAGESTFLLGCGCPFGPAIGVVDAMRIGPDTAPAWEPYFHWLAWASPLIRGNPSIPALRNAVRNTLVMSSLHKQWWWNDPDCLLVRDVDSRLTEAEVKSAVSLVGLSGGLLVSSDDLGKVSVERLKWLSRLIPSLGLKGVPLDLLKQEMPSLYQVKVDHAGQPWQLVALFNWANRPADCRLYFSDLGYQLGASLHVFDFWAEEYRRVAEPVMLFTGVPAHGCKLLRLCEVGDTPLLVGDTLHISQGMEVSSMRIADKVVTIETTELGRRADGKLWLALPAASTQAYCNGELVEVEVKGEGVYAMQVEFMGKAEIVIELGEKN